MTNASRVPRTVRPLEDRQLRFPVARNKTELAYRQWAVKNPDVIAMFLNFARERMTLGKPFGLKALWERVRWEQALLPERTDPFRLNNNHVSYVVRDLLEIEPRLRSYIRTRRVRGET